VTARELQDDWSILDMLDAHAALDVRDDLEAAASAPTREE
jgi:hypothetical protein